MGRPKKIVLGGVIYTRRKSLNGCIGDSRHPRRGYPEIDADFEAYLNSTSREGTFQLVPIRKWTTQKIKNRLRWLKAQRMTLTTASALQENHEKIVKYTRHLFARLSPEGVEKDRKKFNKKRREDRAKAKTKRLLDMARSAQSRQREARKAMRIQGTTNL